MAMDGRFAKPLTGRKQAATLTVFVDEYRCKNGCRCIDRDRASITLNGEMKRTAHGSQQVIPVTNMPTHKWQDTGTAHGK
eukprot:scaffold4492_cov107-Cylindrotheca_fusiformis.AAC.2